MDYKGFTVWFTGLPGSGKSTLSKAVSEKIRERGLRVEQLDSNKVRDEISSNLGYSQQDRDTHVKRLGWVSSMLSRNNVVSVVAAVSPYKATRDAVRQQTGQFVEVFLEADAGKLAERDLTGMYADAKAGKLDNFTGVNGPYEAPTKPEVHLRTDGDESADAAVDKIMRTLELMNLVPPHAEGDGITPEEEARIVDRLKSLGYV